MSALAIAALAVVVAGWPATGPAGTTEPSPPTTAAALGADHPSVVVEPGRISLDGPVVLVSSAGPSGPAEAWVLDGGGIRAHGELDRSGRGDVLVSGGRLAYLAPRDLVTLDLQLAGPVRSPGSAHRLLPASEVGTAWAIDEASTEATRVDLETGEAIEVVAIESVVAGVRAAVADRFVVVAAGRTHLWSPETGFSALPPSSDGATRFGAAAGDTLFVVSPGPMLTTIDVATGVRSDVALDLGSATVTEMCPSPTLRYVALATSTGGVTVIDRATGAVAATFDAAGPVGAVGWTSPGELVVLGSDHSLTAVDFTEMAATLVASIGPGSGGRVTVVGTASSCS